MLHLGHQLADSFGRLHCIGAGQLIDRDNRRGRAVQAADNAVVLPAKLDPGDISDSNRPAVRALPHDDVAELFR